MHHIFSRQGLSSFSAKRRRTVSRERLSCGVRRTISPASSSRVHRARPSGGLEQAVATSSASSWPESLRAAPGRAPSLSARSRLPSTKRRLVRRTVEALTTMLAAIASSLWPAWLAKQDLRPLQLAGGVLAAAEHGLELTALGLAQVDPVAYVHPCLPGGEHGLSDEAPDVPPWAQLHGQAGSVLGLHRCLHTGPWPCAGRGG